ncbi:uncharacterized protein (DUF305 family) [Deinococcus metalli]|uniref:Uncharacterized protein (DUF305 family) n=1 Tax=Deinococcus metalli TaxID=1141878 RepID=A0A7W8KL53_9DEIO|nr:DUF305 domain-containing protein [Deinococcus metalli]MBB5379006.1 uncharacterized protein (DUF305 family) [Deinococcus metalli]GHF63411.1 hypothetical protein GCM10017781_44190 [Deinococcus metalli]
MNSPLVTLLTTLTLTSFATAQMNHANMTSTTGVTMMGGQGMAGSMGTMMRSMGGLDHLTGRSFDRAFLSMMIPHHQAAVQMSQAILKSTTDPQIKTWATAIVSDQNREIAQMTALLRAYGGPNTQMARQMMGMMGGMKSGAASTDKDQAFVQAMIPHHGSAIMMADMALMRSQDAAILKLAQGIVTAQAQEMVDFQQYLRQ